MIRDGRSDPTDPASPERLGSTFLIVDDDGIFRERLAKALAARGFDVRTASNASDGLELARVFQPALALVDIRMPEKSGLELVQELQQESPGTRTVVLSGYGSVAATVEAMRLGADNVISKPADVDDILAAYETSKSPAFEATQVEYAAPSLARAEWEHINRVLTDCGGNVSEAARRLGIHRRSLQRKLQRFAPD
jgi:two-component system response regulator RegA